MAWAWHAMCESALNVGGDGQYRLVSRFDYWVEFSSKPRRTGFTNGGMCANNIIMYRDVGSIYTSCGLVKCQKPTRGFWRNMLLKMRDNNKGPLQRCVTCIMPRVWLLFTVAFTIALEPTDFCVQLVPDVLCSSASWTSGGWSSLLTCILWRSQFRISPPSMFPAFDMVMSNGWGINKIWRALS
jgi:hypothetical protein